MVCLIRTLIKIHTSTQCTHMTNLVNELANMRIVDTDNINVHIIHVNNHESTTKKLFLAETY